MTGPLLRPGRPGLRAGAHPRPGEDGRVRARDAGHRGVLHARRAVLARAARHRRLRRRVPGLPRRGHRPERLVDGPRGARAPSSPRSTCSAPRRSSSGGPARRATSRTSPTRGGPSGPRRWCSARCLVVFGFWPRLLLDVIDATTSGLPEPRGPRGGGAPAMTPWFQLLGPALAVAGARGPGARRGRAAGPAGAGCGAGSRWSLLGLLAAVPWTMSSAGAAPHGAYVAGAWSLFVQRVLVCAGILAILGSMDWLESARRRAARPSTWRCCSSAPRG